MPSSSLRVVVQHLRAAAEWDGAGRTDEELLTHFLSRRDEDALAALVQRHAPMVWGVCRRVLRHPHDVEDAFQATFLVLVQKAATVVPREMVGNWLHGVAHQTAVRLRATAAKRGWREVQMYVMPEPAVVEAGDEELLSRLDEELGRLPERCRALIVLCDLEGRTRKEVARQLGCPEGTVASGLVRARALLAKRLTRRGLAVSGGSLAATLSHSVASADVPASMVTSTINVATLLTAGKAAGVISGPVATLTQGVLKTMFLKKIVTTTMVVLAMGMAVITGGSLVVGQTEGKSAVGKELMAPVAEKPVAPAAKQKKANREPEVAWGKEVDGLQLGLVLVPADKTAFRPGATMEFVVKVRNLSKEKITLSYGRPESTPTITDGTGEKVHVVMPWLLGIIEIPTEQVLQPGETVDLYHRKVAVEGVQTGGAEQTGHVGTPTIRVGAGKYKIAFPEFVTQDLVRSTGEVEFEVKGGDEKKQPEQKEAFTAWGKEVGGLQAGLDIRNADSIRIGGKVQAVVKVRNVSKETIKVSAWPLWAGHYPGVVDARGNRVRTTTPPEVDFEVIPNPLTLKSGETVVVEKTEIRVAALKEQVVVPEGVVDMLTIHVEPGKFKTDCVGFLKEHPALGTGTVEFEVKDEKPKLVAQKVYTPDEVVREKYDPQATRTVEFKVVVVTKPTGIKQSPDKDSRWVVGHGPNDVSLLPYPPKKADEREFSVILSANVVDQLKRIGITDVGKHFDGKTIRASGRINQHRYVSDDPPEEPHYDLVIEDVRQFEAVK